MPPKVPQLQENRFAAEANGEVHFSIDLPCKKGHYAPRLTSTGACCECASIAARRWRDKNRDRYNEMARIRRATNPGENDYRRAYQSAYRKTEAGKAATERATERHANKFKRVRDKRLKEAANG